MPIFSADQLLNLNEEKPTARFEIPPERTWPTEIGKPEVCLWKDDKLAAISVTIDDNEPGDVDWWLEKSEAYGKIPLTWFLVTSRISDIFSKGKKTWADWADIQARGHLLASHTLTHNQVNDPLWKDYENECTVSIADIEKNVSGHRVLFHAYPGGPGSEFNDRNTAAKYFAAARGVWANINNANKIDYLRTTGTGSFTLTNEEKKIHIPALLDPQAVTGYRGWAVILFHGIETRKVETEALLAFIQKKSADIWAATFGDVAIYGQSRDTAQIRNSENSDMKIAFTLTDRMKDEVFCLPLTVKILLPANWKTLSATQNEKVLPAKIIEHEGKQYALIDAVPDKGLVLVTR